MPELPEVESLRRILARSVTGRTIVSAQVSEARLRRRVSPSFGRQVAHRKILGLNRRAKYLVMEFDTELRMLIHLGMSGSLTHRDKDFANNSLDGRHDHVRFFLDDDTTLVYNDPRRFIWIRLLSSRGWGRNHSARTSTPSTWREKRGAANLRSRTF